MCAGLNGKSFVMKVCGKTICVIAEMMQYRQYMGNARLFGLND